MEQGETIVRFVVAIDGRVNGEIEVLKSAGFQDFDVEAVSAPGEVAPEMGARMHDTLRARHRLILGLCDDEVGYVLEPGMFDDPEYRYEATVSLGRDTAAVILAAQEALVAEGWA